jgi:hypothetical protein
VNFHYDTRGTLLAHPILREVQSLRRYTKAHQNVVAIRRRNMMLLSPSRTPMIPFANRLANNAVIPTLHIIRSGDPARRSVELKGTNELHGDPSACYATDTCMPHLASSQLTLSVVRLLCVCSSRFPGGALSNLGRYRLLRFPNFRSRLLAPR